MPATAYASHGNAPIGQEVLPGAFVLQSKQGVVLALLALNNHTPFVVWSHDGNVPVGGDYHSDLRAAIAAFDQRRG